MYSSFLLTLFLFLPIQLEGLKLQSVLGYDAGRGSAVSSGHTTPLTDHYEHEWDPGKCHLQLVRRSLLQDQDTKRNITLSFPRSCFPLKISNHQFSQRFILYTYWNSVMLVLLCNDVSLYSCIYLIKNTVKTVLWNMIWHLGNLSYY